jgi:hypothetical protein
VRVNQSLRLEYARLAEALAESGLVDKKSLRDALQYSSSGGTAFPRALVEANLVTDWEISRVVCELYSLPFVPIEVMDPDPGAFTGIDPDFLLEHALVPLGRFGQVLTVCMPALVEADVLAMLSAQTDYLILPVVGTVRSNRIWLETNLTKAAPKAAPGRPAGTASSPAGAGSKLGLDGDETGAWGSFFDEADAAVLMDLKSIGDELQEPDGEIGHAGPDELPDDAEEL